MMTGQPANWFDADRRAEDHMPAHALRPGQPRTIAQTDLPPGAVVIPRQPAHLRDCPTDTTCDRCGGPLRRGMPVRPTNGQGETDYMHPACFFKAGSTARDVRPYV